MMMDLFVLRYSTLLRWPKTHFHNLKLQLDVEKSNNNKIECFGNQKNDETSV